MRNALIARKEHLCGMQEAYSIWKREHEAEDLALIFAFMVDFFQITGLYNPFFVCAVSGPNVHGEVSCLLGSSIGSIRLKPGRSIFLYRTFLI